MSQKTANFGADYQAMAQQSLEAWKNMWTQATGQSLDKAAAQFTGSSTDNTASEAVERTLEGLKNYCSWMESMSAASAATPGGMRWDQAFSKAFADMPSQAGFGQAFSGFPGAGQQAGPQQWIQQFMQTMAPMQQSAESLLGMPAFGLNREHQEHAQALGRAWLEYLEQSARYQQLVSRVGKQAAEMLQDQLSEHEAPGRQVDTLRGLYNLWVDAAEEAWGKIAMSDEYREVYGAMVNAQMRVRSLLQQQVAESSSQLGMPTRSEVDSLGQRLQELRREVKSASSQSLSEELAQLRAELGRLRGSQRRSTTSTSRAASKKSASRKATVKKQAASKKATSKSTAGKTAGKRTSRRSVADKSRSRKNKES